MATFSKNNFIIPVGVDSKNLKIRDIKGQLKHTILNNSNTTFLIERSKPSTIVIRTNGDSSDILLDFSCPPEAIQALSLLNAEYAKLRMNMANKKQSDLIDLIDDMVGDAQTATIEPRNYTFSSEPDANELMPTDVSIYKLPTNARKIHSVYVNGVVINDYTFDSASTSVILSTPIVDFIGYDIDETDEILIKYFV